MRENYEEILSRLKKVLSAKSDADVARGLDVSTAALSAFKKQGKFPYERLVKFCLTHSVSIDWLFTGEGEMKRGERGERPHITAEPAVAYNVKDVEMQEIVGFLKENPVDKKVILKLIKSKKMAKEAMEEFAGVKGLVEES